MTTYRFSSTLLLKRSSDNPSPGTRLSASADEAPTAGGAPSGDGVPSGGDGRPHGGAAWARLAPEEAVCLPPAARVVAWDIETCPLPEARLAPAQKAYLDRKAEEIALSGGLPLPAARRKAAALSPVAGRICSIAAVRGGRYGAAGDPIVYLAPEPEGEPALLEAFWADVERLPPAARWVTFNGKRFDVGYVVGRTLHHGMEPSRKGLIGTHPYRAGSHVDLRWLLAGHALRLQDLCALLGVPSPKAALGPGVNPDSGPDANPDAEGMDGSQVAEAMAAGRFGAVAAYNAADALATLRCFQAVPEKAVTA